MMVLDLNENILIYLNTHCELHLQVYEHTWQSPSEGIIM